MFPFCRKPQPLNLQRLKKKTPPERRRRLGCRDSRFLSVRGPGPLTPEPTARTRGGVYWPPRLSGPAAWGARVGIRAAWCPLLTPQPAGLWPLGRERDLETGVEPYGERGTELSRSTPMQPRQLPGRWRPASATEPTPPATGTRPGRGRLRSVWLDWGLAGDGRSDPRCPFPPLRRLRR